MKAKPPVGPSRPVHCSQSIHRLTLVLIFGLLAAVRAPAAAVYQTTFDGLATGPLLPSPGVPGQDGWCQVAVPAAAVAEIQTAIARGSNALHASVAMLNPPGSQTVVTRPVSPPDLAARPLVTLSFEFYAHSSFLMTLNAFGATLSADGGPHPGYQILGVGVGGGNGTPRSDTGVGVALSCFNGTNNNEAVALTVGQGLAWDAWHQVTVAMDQAADEYLQITVDAATQSLAGVRLPRSEDAGVWKRGRLIESLTASIVAPGWLSPPSDDHIYWDNIVLTASPRRAAWSQRHGDAGNTGRADYSVPAVRQGTNFFNALRWQKRAPNSPGEGSLGSSAMVFFDGAGPGGTDLVVGGYHWPKGVQGMDRHTGKYCWNGNPDGGESIGDNTPAFSPDGATIYVINDATPHPLMAFAATNGPSAYWHNGADADPTKLGAFSPKTAPDGRIFAHAWDDRPYAGTDSGSAIAVSWSVGASLCECISLPAIWTTPTRTNVVAAGRCGAVSAFDGTSGAELWRRSLSDGTDADPTVDPANGNVYLPVGFSSIQVVGLSADGDPLWSSVAEPVFAWQDGVNNPQRCQSAGCLAHDGLTYYFQTVSQAGDGQLYAINTTNGAVKWSCATGSKGWEMQASAPIVTPDGIVIVGNNDGGMYFAVRDDGTNATLLDTLPVAAGGSARSSATISPDGLLYLPARLAWVQSNGDGETPTQNQENLFNAFDLLAVPEVDLPPPGGLQGQPLNAAVELRWLPVSDAAGVFSHYAIYRATTPFTSLAGLTPLATVSNRLATGFTDTTVTNGGMYYYAVVSVTVSGRLPASVTPTSAMAPFDETDLQVVTISRTPRYPRYDAQYTGYEVTEPSGFGPYSFTAATGLGSGQTTNTQRWPAPGDPMTYTATVRNRGSNPFTNSIGGLWTWDGTNAATAEAGPLAPGELTTFTLVRPWDGASHDLTFTITNQDARAANNTLALNTKSVAFLTYMDASYYQAYRVQTRNYPQAVTDDLIDWLNRHMARFNQMFAAAGCAKRVHFDVLEVLNDTEPDPAIDRLCFAIFPFRYRVTDGDARLSGYYHADEDIDYGLLHEMGHQLGLIDIYQMDLSADANLVSHLGYSAPDDLMRGCSPFLCPHSALAMNHWLDQAHGYFGQYLYGLPAQIQMRFLGFSGQPLRGATVKMYQLEDRPGLGKVISTQLKAQGLTDTNGVWTLPNVPVDPAKVPPLPTGDVLRDNPFGYVAVIGANGLLHFRVEQDGFVDYAWLDITEPNVAFYQGQTNAATFTRTLALGGAVQSYPPPELSEADAASWYAWAEGSAAGNTWVTNDPARAVVGTNALKFVTLDGGFDTFVRYPGSGLARWNLAGAQTLKVRFYAENPNGGFQSGSPWLRLKDPGGNYLEYQFYQDGGPLDLLNQAIGQWLSCEIPLAAGDTVTDGWRRTTFGTPDLTRIASLEIHVDTWGYGFTVWVDGVSFEPPLRPALTIEGAGDEVILRWLPGDTFVPEAADALGGPYQPVSLTPTNDNGRLSVRLPRNPAGQFFRLKSR